MNTKSNKVPVAGEEQDHSNKVKAFRTSSRLRLPQREVKPEDDSVYDRFLGAVEKQNAPQPATIAESKAREAVSRIELSSPSPILHIENPHSVQQKADPNVDKHSAINPDLPHSGSQPNLKQAFNTARFIREISKIYRLNAGESVIIRALCEMSHAQGKDECEVTVPRVMAQTKLTEQRVRRSLKSLRNKGWIYLVKEFDPRTHTPAVYKVLLSPS